MRVIGVMSGTSHDAIEVAAADFAVTAADFTVAARTGRGAQADRTGGSTVTAVLLGTRTVPLDPELRAAVAALLPPAVTAPAGVAAQVCRLHTWLGQAFAEAAALANRELCDGRADLVVCHGQTVHHWVEDGRALGTLQLGAPAWIAERTGAPVVSDLRTRDITRGGQGAPLVSLFDQLLLPPGEAPRAALNLGGIANLTVIPPAVPPVVPPVIPPAAADHGAAAPAAFDVGPANALIDAAVAELTGGRETMDTDGRRARRGTVHAGLLADLLADPYYALPPPKSTGKERFNAAYLAAMTARHPDVRRSGSGDDLVATLTQLTATVVANALTAQGPAAGVTELVVSGGGTRNPALMAALQAALPQVAVCPVDTLGIPGHAKEALAFALLGFLTVHGLPGTIPSCTGARSAALLGSITPGDRPLRLPEPVTTPPRRLRIVNPGHATHP